MKQIVFTVTNDLSYDQRMHRICGSLSCAGYRVLLVGRKLPSSIPLENKLFQQKRISCIFNKGFLFYAEYNTRLFFYLLGRKSNAICAIDLDTILPCLLLSKIKGWKRVYDAHEYFTELKEVRSSQYVKMVWEGIEKLCIPHFRFGYTVSQGLADAFNKEYQKEYEVIRNMPVFKKSTSFSAREKILYYQGAVNEGRGFESLIPAMKTIAYRMIVCGDGNFMEQLKALIRVHGVEDKVELKGMVLPEELKKFAESATLGMGLSESEGLNQYLALPNKFFDYMHAGLPQLAMNFPEYRKINDQFKVAVLADDLDPVNISRIINQVMLDENLLNEMHENCLQAREIYCWQNEEIKLIEFYRDLFNE
jgi:glycosyltransferase involved in cell wall biosynthesis